MGDRLLQILDFFIERPPLTGALVWGALYMIKRSRKVHLSEDERHHALRVAESQRTYADTMYELPPDEAAAEKKKPEARP